VGVDFTRHLELITSIFNILPLDEAVQKLRTRGLPPRPACITFDDGYADNAEIALPLLRKFGVTATFFISTGFLDGRIMWNDMVIESVRQAIGDTLDLSSIELGAFSISTKPARRATVKALLSALKYLEASERADRCAAIVQIARATLPPDIMLRSADVKALHEAGMGIGAHTVNHPILSRLPPGLAEREISEGREKLQEITGSSISLFAYPNGKPDVDYDRRHVAIVRKLGFDAAVSTGWGVASATTDPFQLPRFTPWDKTPSGFTIRLLRNLVTRERACE
jgi:peptidoglycan/xylan/chitin deacetylase (PgdA/CDA1 family)